jgi:predicted RNase H-like HicB family nuclease
LCLYARLRIVERTQEWQMTKHKYNLECEPLPPSEGGGWLATVPDLPGCMSDGDTREEAEANVKDAIECWIAAARRLGRPVPQPAKAIRQRA